jgi:hypothetical protein
VVCAQGRSQGSTGSTVVRGPWRGGPEWSLGGPRKGPRKEAAQERAVKAKVGAVCFLEKGRKKKKKIKVKGSLGALGALRSQKRGPTQSQRAEVGQNIV